MEFHVAAQDGETVWWIGETWSQVVQVGHTPVPSCVWSTAKPRWTGDMRGRKSTHEWNLWFVWPRIQDSDNTWCWQGPKLWHCPSLYWKARYRPGKCLQEKKKWWRPDTLTCEMGILHCHRVLLRIKQKVMQTCHAWDNRGGKYIYIYTCIYIYIYTHTYIYMSMYIYIHIQINK